MLVGAISDTHDNLPQIEKAVKYLNDQKVGLVLHAGDYVAGFVLSQIQTAKLQTHRRLRQQRWRPRTPQRNGSAKPATAQSTKDSPKLRWKVSESRFCTGKKPNCSMQSLKADIFDAVIHGHSHYSRVEKRGKTLAINPGELCGYLTGKCTH